MPSSSRDNQTLVSLQPARKAHQDRSEGCPTQQIRHVSDGRVYDGQEVVLPRYYAELHDSNIIKFNYTVIGLIQWIRITQM